MLSTSRTNAAKPARLVHFIRSAKTLAEAERHQAVLRLSLLRIETLGVAGDLDEVFYDEFRESLLAAGATAADIDAVADYMVRFVVEGTRCDADEQLVQFQLITNHLACTDMNVRVRDGATVIRVDFPNRPKVQ